MILPDYLIDSNTLVFSVHRSSPFHTDTMNAFEILLRAGHRLCVTPQNVVEFWNVCTRPIDRNGLGLSAAEADREILRLERMLILLPDTPAIYPEWRRLVVIHGVCGAQVHDARLVAVMNVYQITHIFTLNERDFRRYSHIRAILPKDLLASED